MNWMKEQSTSGPIVELRTSRCASFKEIEPFGADFFPVQSAESRDLNYRIYFLNAHFYQKGAKSRMPQEACIILAIAGQRIAIRELNPDPSTLRRSTCVLRRCQMVNIFNN
jgi:hypothetical protein